MLRLPDRYLSRLASFPFFKELEDMSWTIKGLGKPFDLIIPQGSASLIIGECGTGKTTLGIQFLVDGAKNDERGLLILGEQSERDSLRFFKHLNLETYIKENKIVILDASKSKLAVTEAIPSESIVKSLRAEFNSTLVRVFEEIEKKGVKRLVIDSLQSFLILTTGDPNILTPRTFSPIRGHIFKIMELCRLYGVTSLFISEGLNIGRAPLGFEEYIADSVLVLSKRRLNNRKIREITFDKIRGVRISQDTFLATMEGGRFRAFPPHRKRLPPILLQPEPVPDPSKDYISTGIDDLDLILDGGFEKGSWNLIEVAHGVGTIFEITLPLLTNHLNLGRGVIMVVPEGLSVESLRRVEEHFVGKKRFEKQCTFFERAPPENIQHVEALVDNGENAFQMIRSAREKLCQNYGTPVLTFLGLGTLEHTYDFDLLVTEIGKTVADSRTMGDVMVALTKEGQRCTATVSYMATTHWKLETINKALTMHGIIPQTEYYAVEMDISKGYVRPQLIPVV